MRIAACSFQCGEGGGVAKIAEYNSRVAEQPGTPRSPEGCLAKPDAEGILVERKQRDQVEGRVPGLESRLVGRTGEAAIPWADFLADIAPEDPIPQERTERFRDGRAMFNGKVGDAAPGVERARRDQRSSGTRVRAGSAAATTVGRRGCVGFQIEIEKQLPQEEIGTAVGVDEIGIFPDPAQAGSLG